MSQHDPAETFNADQAEAAAEHRTREQVSWDLNVRNSEAQALNAEAHAMRNAAMARLWRLTGSAIWLLGLWVAALLVLSFFGVGTWGQ